jgi:hypothetical protein
VSRLPRTETLLVLACAAASATLAASQFITIFELTPPGGEALEAVSAADQHGYATLVLAVFALVMLVAGIATQNEQAARIAAFAVAASGAVALLIFLVGDLPDANTRGTLDDSSFIDAEAEPQAGFWLELIGSLVLAVCGGALATLGPDKLNLLPGRGGSAGKRRIGVSPPAAESTTGNGASEGGEKEEEKKGGGLFQWPSRGGKES